MPKPTLLHHSCLCWHRAHQTMTTNNQSANSDFKTKITLFLRSTNLYIYYCVLFCHCLRSLFEWWVEELLHGITTQKIDFKGIVLLTPHATDHENNAIFMEQWNRFRFGAHFFKVSIMNAFILNEMLKTWEHFAKMNYHSSLFNDIKCGELTVYQVWFFCYS